MSGTASVSEIEYIAREIATLHRFLDEKTKFLKAFDCAEGELARRAEEAGAALQRLEWELTRFQSKYRSCVSA